MGGASRAPEPETLLLTTAVAEGWSALALRRCPISSRAPGVRRSGARSSGCRTCRDGLADEVGDCRRRHAVGVGELGDVDRRIVGVERREKLACHLWQPGNGLARRDRAYRQVAAGRQPRTLSRARQLLRRAPPGDLGRTLRRTRRPAVAFHARQRRTLVGARAAALRIAIASTRPARRSDSARQQRADDGLRSVRVSTRMETTSRARWTQLAAGRSSVRASTRRSRRAPAVAG